MSFALTQRSSVSGGTTSAGSQATGSFTPAANSRLFVFAAAERDNNTATRSWTISDTGSHSWIKLDESTLYQWGDLVSPPNSYHINVVCWYTDISGSPAAMTVTVDASTGNEFYSVIAFDVTGYDTAAPFPQASVDNGANINPASSAASGVLTLGSAPTNGNLVVALFGAGADMGGGFATPTGYTVLTNQSQGYTQAGAFYHVTTTTAAVTCSDLGQTVGAWGGIVFEMKLAGGGVTDKALAGSLTPAATVLKRTGHPMTGSAAPAGITLKFTGKVLAGSLTSAATVLKRTGHLMTGAMSPVAGLVKRSGKILSGAFNPAAITVKQTGKVLAGAASPIGAIIRHTNKGVAGVMSSAGALATIRAVLYSLSGAVGAAGTLTRLPGKTLAGAMIPAASLSRQIARTLSGALTSAGGVTSIRAVLLALSGALGLTANLTQQVAKPLSGAVASGGATGKQVARSLAGSLTPAGIMTAARVALLSLTGAFSPVGVVARQSSKGVSGALALSGATLKITTRALSGALSLAGGLIGQWITVSITTPASRIFTILAEVRRFIIPAEDRQLIISAEDRTFTIE